MAEKATLSWINGIINKINNLISTKSNINDSLAKISANSKITTENINIINNMLNKMKADYYLSTVSNLFIVYAVQKNELIYENFYNNMNNMEKGWSQIVCKNDATNSNGLNSNGTNSHGTQSNGYEYEGTENTPYNYAGNRSQNNITIKDHTHLRNGTHDNETCSQGACSKGVSPNVTNVKTTNSHSV